MSISVDATTLGPIGQQGAQAANHDAFAELDMQSFIQMMIAELQNQDPLNPMDNVQILQQMSQIREIQSNQTLTDTLEALSLSNQTLTDTLEALALGQNVSTASSMIGDWVMTLDDIEGQQNMVQVVGPVDRVIVEEGAPKLAVDDRLISLNDNLKLQVLAEEAGVKMQEIMEKDQHEVQWRQDAATGGSAEYVGFITGVSLVNGDIQFPRYHVVDSNTGQLDLISPDQIVSDLTEPDGGADDQTSATP